MAVHRYLLLIIVLCCAALICGTLLNANDVETCNFLCGQCNTAAVFANGYCECSFPDSDVKNVECVKRLQRESETVDLNILPEDLTDEKRDVRSLKSKHRLRTEAASPDVETYSTNHPIFDYPTTNGLYDTLMGVPHHTRHHSHHLHRNPLLRALNLPKHILHNLLGHHVHHYHYYPAHHRRNALVRSTNNQDTVAASNPMSDNSQYDAKMSPISDINTTHQPMQYYYQPDTGYYYTPYSNPLMNPYPLNYYSPSFHTPLVPCSIVPSHWQDTPKQTKIPTAKTDDNVAKINNVDEKKTKTKVKNDKSK